MCSSVYGGNSVVVVCSSVCGGNSVVVECVVVCVEVIVWW